MPETPYARPEIQDYGTLSDLTAACFGVTGQDELGKTFQIIRSVSTPLVGDQKACAP